MRGGFLSQPVGCRHPVVLYVCHSWAGWGSAGCVPSLGRPAIVSVRIGRGVVRIPVAGRASGIIRIAAKAQALELHPFSDLRLRLQGPRSRCRAWPHAGGLRPQRYFFFLILRLLQKKFDGHRPYLPAHCVGLYCACGADCVRLRLLKASLGRPAKEAGRSGRGVRAIDRKSVV